MAMESTSGLKRVVFTQDTGKRIGCTVKAALNTQTEEFSMACLSRTKSMETGVSSGQIEGSTEEPTCQILKKAMESLSGRMGESILVTGFRESNMEMGCTYLRVAVEGKASGNKAS